MFGYEYEITNEFPQYFRDYREEMDDTVRWTHRITSSSGDWSGNLYDFFWRVYPRLKSDIDVPFDLQDGVSRVDEPAAYMAFRELLLNSLAHADHYGRQGIVIRRTPNSLYMANPGDIRIGLEAAIQGGTSDPRNSIIMNMFGLVGIGDRAGLGMPDAIATIEQTIGGKVNYSVSLEPERTMLSIDIMAKSSDKTRDKIEKQGISRDKTRDKIGLIEGISSKTRDNLEKMIDYFKFHTSVKNHEIAELLNVSDDRARVLLLILVDNGLLIAKGDRKERTYHLK